MRSRPSIGTLIAIATAGCLSRAAPCDAETSASLATPGPHLGIGLGSYPAISEASAVASRLLTPLAWEGVKRKLTASSTALEPELFDSRQARFTVYVPSRRPEPGYGLLVFVSPSNESSLPGGWAPILDRFGMVFISADGSGNDQKVLERRVPLALAAQDLVRSQLPVDPSRIFVGGFSGGSRVALRIALAYPDLFHGAFLNAGSDAVGNRDAPLPSPALMSMVRGTTRFAFATGHRDEGGLALDNLSIPSLKHWCVANIVARTDHDTGHEVARSQTLDWALRYLTSDSRVRPADACLAARSREMEAALDKVRNAMASSERDRARELLLDLDGQYGGLVRPYSIDLAQRCACGILDNSPGGASVR